MPVAARAKALDRLWPIDALRGFAVLGMVFYHAMWDLSFVGVYPGDVTLGGWRIFARSVASTFLLLVGFNLILLAARTPPAVARRRWLERGLKLLGWGIVISLITWPLFGPQFIAYGVLHFIGTVLLLAPAILRLQRFSIPLAAVFLLGGPVLANRPVDTVWLLPLGLRPPHYVSVDYFPIFPWLGVVLLGVGLGRAYLTYRANTLPAPSAAPAWARPAVFLGRHSLTVYILHQPVIIAILLLLGVRFF